MKLNQQLLNLIITTLNWKYYITYVLAISTKQLVI